jgi:hypothetical protein
MLRIDIKIHRTIFNKKKILNRKTKFNIIPFRSNILVEHVDASH